MDSKVCSKCNVEKGLGEFYKKASTYDGLRSECKACKFKVDKVRQLEHTAINRQKVYDIYKNTCEGCGLTHDKLRFFDFHHKDPLTKTNHVSSLMVGTWDRLSRELDLCEMLCPNCHKERHLVEGMGFQELKEKRRK